MTKPTSPAIRRPGLDRPVTIKTRRDHHIVSVAVIVAVAVNTDGRREVLGMTVGDSEAEPFWTGFLRGLRQRGLRGVKLVISDAHDGLKAAITKSLDATWQRCRFHFMRNAMAHAGKTQRRIRRRLDRDRFRRDRPRRGANPMAQGRRPGPATGAEAGDPDGRGGGRCSRPHRLPRRASRAAVQHQPARAAEQGDQAPKRRPTGRASPARGQALVSSPTRPPSSA